MAAVLSFPARTETAAAAEVIDLRQAKADIKLRERQARAVYKTVRETIIVLGTDWIREPGGEDTFRELVFCRLLKEHPELFRPEASLKLTVEVKP
jgi:hypothetical protein